MRVILADGSTVQWLAVTNGGLTVGGTTTISTAPPGLNKSTILAAIQAIAAAGGPQLTPQQVTLLGGKVSGPPPLPLLNGGGELGGRGLGVRVAGVGVLTA